MLAALGVVFLAELGDKTQLVALGLGARYRLAPVLAGVVIAYATTNLLSVLVGGLLGAAFPTRTVAIGGGVLFLAYAVWILRPSARGPTDHDHGEPLAGREISADRAGAQGLGRARSVVLSVALAMFLAELGDKTMLATATLAAGGHPALVWVGATLGIVASGLVGVLLGRLVGARLPERVTETGSALLFAVFGVVMVATNL